MPADADLLPIPPASTRAIPPRYMSPLSEELAGIFARVEVRLER